MVFSLAVASVFAVTVDPFVPIHTWWHGYPRLWGLMPLKGLWGTSVLPQWLSLAPASQNGRHSSPACSTVPFVPQVDHRRVCSGVLLYWSETQRQTVAPSSLFFKPQLNSRWLIGTNMVSAEQRPRAPSFLCPETPETFFNVSPRSQQQFGIV